MGGLTFQLGCISLFPSFKELSQKSSIVELSDHAQINFLYAYDFSDKLLSLVLPDWEY